MSKYPALDTRVKIEAEVERLRREQSAMRGIVEASQGEVERLRAENTKLQAEVAGLRKLNADNVPLRFAAQKSNYGQD